MNNINSPAYNRDGMLNMHNGNNCLTTDPGYYLPNVNMQTPLSQEPPIALDIIRSTPVQESSKFAKKMRYNNDMAVNVKQEKFSPDKCDENSIMFDPMDPSLNETINDNSISVVKTESVINTTDDSIKPEDYEGPHQEHNINLLLEAIQLIVAREEEIETSQSKVNESEEMEIGKTEVQKQIVQNTMHIVNIKEECIDQLESCSMNNELRINNIKPDDIPNTKTENFSITANYADVEAFILKQSIMANDSHENIKDSDVLLGNNGTTIKMSVAQNLNWDNPKKALRDLLVAVFTRPILATHTLTGRASPAFLKRDTNPKPRLDPKKVSDICQFCQSKVKDWPERTIRKLITSKCADDGRMREDLFSVKSINTVTSNKNDSCITSTKTLGDSNNNKDPFILDLLKSKYSRRKRNNSYLGKSINHTSTQPFEEGNKSISSQPDIIPTSSKSNHEIYVAQNDITKYSVKGKIKLGDNGTTINGEDVQNINWEQPEKGLRKVLVLLFDRETLATHTLTGKKAPAFQNKEATPRLDPRIVNDFEQYFLATEKCRNCHVREVITSKCADERKMKKLRLERNKENNS